MEELVEVTKRLKKVEETLADNTTIIKQGTDADLVEIARAEMDSLEEEKTKLEEQFQLLIVPKDPADDKNTIMEIRAGTGGDEAALFAGDLLRMYTRYAERKGWKAEVLSSSETGNGRLQGSDPAGDRARARYGALKYESGVHRVQRVPETEASGRIHTSAAYRRRAARSRGSRHRHRRQRPARRRLPLQRAGRAGCQHDRLRGAHHPPAHRTGGHLPGRERSQIKNKAKALKVLQRAPPDRARSEAGREAGRGARAARSAPATGVPRSAPTTSRSSASPTTVSDLPPTRSTPSWTASSTI